MEDAYFSEVDALLSRIPEEVSRESSEWMVKLTPEMRAKALFVSKVESASLLSRMQQEVVDFLSEQTEEVEGPDGVKRIALKADGKATFIEKMRARMLKEGIVTGDELAKGDGTVTELASTNRLELIFDTITRQSHGYAEWRQSMEEPLISAFPARRFVRIPGAEYERRRHDEAENAVRLKTDFKWWAFLQNGADIGGFEVPWEPFGFNSYMTTENVTRKQAERMKLIKKGQKQKAPKAIENYNAGVQASTEKLDPRMVKKLQIDLDQIAEVSAKSAKMKIDRVLDKPLVSNAMNVVIRDARKKEATQAAMDAIDEVHSDGVLTTLKVTGKRDKGSHGSFNSNPNGREINLSTIDHPELTVAHEVGHLLDYDVLSGKTLQERAQWLRTEGRKYRTSKAFNNAYKDTFAGSRSRKRLFKEFFSAVNQSESIKAIAANRRLPRDNREYYLSKHEIFARAYAQYIATNSSNQAMKDQLKKMQRDTELGFGYHTQWSDLDFAPIAQALTNLFSKLRWI